MQSKQSILGPILIFLLAVLSVLLYLRINVDSYAKKFVNNKLDEFLTPGEFSADVREAKFISGVGFEIRGLQIVDANTWGEPVLTVDSILLRCPTEIHSLAQGNFQPTSVDIKRLRLNVNESEIQTDWFERLASMFSRKPTGKLLPVRVRDSVIRLAAAETKTELSDIRCDLIPVESESDQKIDIAIKAGGSGVVDLEVTGHVDLRNRIYSARLNRCIVEFDRQCLSIIARYAKAPNSFVDRMAGNLSLRGAVAGRFDDPVPRFLLNTQISNFSASSRYLPEPIYDCDALVKFENQRLTVENASGRMGGSQFLFSYQQQGLLSRNSWWAKGKARQLEFNSALASKYADGGKKFCNDFSPAGKFDLQFELDSNGKKDITGQITDMSFSFHRFPFRVEHCVGNVKWQNDDLTFQVQALEKQQLLEFSGHVKNPGPQATYVFNFGTQGRLPIDLKVLNSLRNFPNMERAVRDFRPVGFVSGKGRVIKTVPGSKVVQKEIELQVHDCRVRHAKFEYPVHDVNGTVKIDDSGFQFVDVTGGDSESPLFCNGFWSAQKGLQLVFKCDQVPLDDRLRNALTPTLQEVWGSIRPAGKVKSGTVSLNLPPNAPYADIRVQAHIGDSKSAAAADHVNVYPTGFPYRITNMQGELFVGGGLVKLTNAIGRHGTASFGCDGTGSYSDKDWSMRFENLLVGSAQVDEDLFKALPVDLAAGVRQLNYDGTLNVSGAIAFSGTNGEPSEIKSVSSNVQQVSYESEAEAIDIDWDLRLDVDKGQMQVGLPLENIFGSIRLVGRSHGDIAECTGEVSVDSLTVYGMQVAKLQGPIWIDNLQTRAGSFTGGDEGQPRSLVGEAFGGKVTFDGWVSHVNDYPFLFQTTVERSRLEEVVSDLSNYRELSGDGYGFLRLKGNTNEPHTYTGEGSVHLKNAKIHQLPVILALLKILKIKEVNRTAFDSSNVDFSIDGNQMKLDRIELIGDAISLIGNGYLEMMRHLDINFYSVVGRNRIYIPLISDLYKAGSQRTLWINIGGPLGNLQTSRRILPGLDDSLRALIGGPENNHLESETQTKASNQ